MKLNKETQTALTWTSGHSFKYTCARISKRLEKQEYILDYLKGRNASVIDVGCTSHQKNIDEQIKKGLWLHSRLDSVTSENYGIDINAEACEYLKREYHRSDCLCANILIDTEKIASWIGGKKDYIILADVIEHIDDPIGFLRKIKQGKLAENIIITVPNAFHFVNMYFAFRQNSEVINSDHKFWFSPFTLLKCCNEAGIEVDEIDFCGFKLKDRKLPRILCKDIMAQTIFVVGKL